jgi:hypothetical protein
MSFLIQTEYCISAEEQQLFPYRGMCSLAGYGLPANGVGVHSA